MKYIKYAGENIEQSWLPAVLLEDAMVFDSNCSEFSEIWQI